MSFGQGYNRTMAAAGLTKTASYEIVVDPRDAFHLGAAAKHDQESYFGPAVVDGLAGAGAAGGLLGAKYRALTGSSMPGTLKDLVQVGPELTMQNIRKGHQQIFAPAREALQEGLPLAEAIKRVDAGQYAKRGLKGLAGGALFGAGVNTLGNALSYGAGYALSKEPDSMLDRAVEWWDDYEF